MARVRLSTARVEMEEMVGAYGGAKWRISMGNRPEGKRTQDVEDGR